MDINNSLVTGIIASSVTFGLSLIFAGLVIFIEKQIIKKEKQNSLLSILLMECKLPISFIIILTGLYWSYLLVIKIEHELLTSLITTEFIVSIIWKVSSLILVTILFARLGEKGLQWYITNISHKTATKIDDNLLPIIRRVLPITVYATGFLISIDSLGVSISPILAGLGLGGLAVALAVQPTLSNFFAGTFVVTDGGLRPGDFIEVDDTHSGYVESVGWRSTKIRSIFNNLVIIPNSKMADSIVTNFYSPTPAMNVIIQCGVSYEANLIMVEEYVLEEARNLIDNSVHANKNIAPFFSYSNFGDSNIDFIVFLQAKDRLGTFKIKSELIKKIHERFNKEGIDINYPVRKIMMGSDNKLSAD
jgi:small-conductance mechanosensitive channel